MTEWTWVIARIQKLMNKRLNSVVLEPNGGWNSTRLENVLFLLSRGKLLLALFVLLAEEKHYKAS